MKNPLNHRLPWELQGDIWKYLAIFLLLTATIGMYADNNGIKVRDTLTGSGRSWTVTGLVALSDYSALFSDNSDAMFDTLKFGVAVVTQEQFDIYDADRP